jgi:hypothetical protein
MYPEDLLQSFLLLSVSAQNLAGKSLSQKVLSKAKLEEII